MVACKFLAEDGIDIVARVGETETTLKLTQAMLFKCGSQAHSPANAS
jgi:hypothetical protein